MINYEKAIASFKAMDKIETLSRLYGYEMAQDNTNWDNVLRYEKDVKQARKELFELITGFNSD